MAFFILVPITEMIYEKLLTGKVSDLYDFTEEDVKQEMYSDYHYIADICVSKKMGKENYLSVAALLIKNFGAVLKKYARVVITSPITEDGMRMCLKIGFKKVAEEIYEEKIYPIYLLECNDEVRKKFERLLKLNI